MSRYSSETKISPADRSCGTPAAGAETDPDGTVSDDSLTDIHALIDSGQTAQALNCCLQLLASQPDHAELMFILAGLQQANDMPEAAVATYQRLLDLEPTLVEAAYNLGLLYQKIGAAEKAETCYRRAVKHDPAFAAAHNNLGVLRMERGEFAAAAACFRTATRIEPQYAEGHFNCGRCLFELNRFEAAAASFQKAVALKPDAANAWHHLGLASQKLRRWDRAISSLQKAIELKPSNSNFYFDMGNLHLDLGDMEAVTAWYRTGVAHAPDNVPRLENLALLLHEHGRLEEALNCYRRIIELEPEHVQAHFNRALLLLRSGRYAQGWQEYEWRLKQRNWSKGYPWRFEKPRWQGDDFGGKTLLVHCEQGFGDSIMFARYLPLVKARGGTVVFEAPAALMRLFNALPGVDRLCALSAGAPPQADFDVYTPLASLAGILGTRPDSIPCQIPYLFADPDQNARWRDRSDDDTCRVGIVWAGSKVHVNDKRRSCSLDDFRSLTKIDGLRLCSLQPEVSGDQIRAGDAAEPIVHWGDRLRDFADTAAAIAALDLIIAVDTAVAHLAGAMGKPIWVLLPYVPDWRWFSDRSDSPWYPTMRLFRQSAPGDWGSVFENVLAALVDFRENHRQRLQR